MIGYQLATDAQFREVSNFATPPRAGRVTAIEGNGQVRVETDDPDGGDVLAWPLNGFTYAVNDVVYLAFAVNSPDSAIVIGGLAPAPTLEGYVPLDGSEALTADWNIEEDRALLAERIEARDGEGLRLEDDGGNLGVFVADGGAVGVGTASPVTTLHVVEDSALAGVVIERTGTYSGTDELGLVQFRYAGDSLSQFRATRDGANDAADFRIATQATGSGTLTDRVAVKSDGKLGHGTMSPQGWLHAHDGVGGMLFVTKTAINATAQTIIPNGSGDVTAGLYFMAVIVTSGGALFGTSNVIALSSNLNIYSSGSDTLNLRVNADGSVDIRRTGGSLTYTVSLFMIWR